MARKQKLTKQTKMKDLPEDLTPSEAEALFGSVVDPAIKILVNAQKKHLGLSDLEFNAIIRQASDLMSACVDTSLMDNLTVEEVNQSFGLLSDLMMLGLLSYRIHSMKQDEGEKWNMLLANMLAGQVEQIIQKSQEDES